LYNTILANSTSGSDCYRSGGTIIGDHNLIETDSPSNPCGTTSPINSDPLLADLLAYHNGDTLNFALLIGSPAFDAGNDATCAAAVGAPAYGAGGLDQRGEIRPQILHCDIGAYELKILKAFLPLVLR
jgi:hypothetical protein